MLGEADVVALGSQRSRREPDERSRGEKNRFVDTFDFNMRSLHKTNICITTSKCLSRMPVLRLGLSLVFARDSTLDSEDPPCS